MKATHTDYLHPKHIRVETGEAHPCFSLGRGSFMRTALCVSPSSELYAKVNRKGLPKWSGGEIVDGIEIPRRVVS